MLFRARRTAEGPDPRLDLRILLFAVGAAAGLAGMGLKIGWLVYVAIAILLFGMVLGLIRRRSDPTDT